MWILTSFANTNFHSRKQGKKPIKRNFHTKQQEPSGKNEIYERNQYEVKHTILLTNLVKEHLYRPESQPEKKLMEREYVHQDNEGATQ